MFVFLVVIPTLEFPYILQILRKGGNPLKTQQTIFELYQSEIYRIAWRLQYKARTIRKRENVLNEIEFAEHSFTTTAENRIFIQQLLNTLPSQGKTILLKLYMEDQTEAEVASQLNISQQAVNKWKKKMLQQLSQTKCS